MQKFRQGNKTSENEVLKTAIWPSHDYGFVDENTGI